MELVTINVYTFFFKVLFNCLSYLKSRLIFILGPENQINVAMSKNVTMSSLWYLPIYHAGSYAVDGQVLNIPGAETCATTQAEVKPWLSIDLGNIYDIDRVVIYNRQDTLGNILIM
jgi:hypothetical protein